jgi:hypothetical protein
VEPGGLANSLPFANALALDAEFGSRYRVPSLGGARETLAAETHSAALLEEASEWRPAE